MSTDKPPAWQTAVFKGSPRDNITPFLAYIQQQKKDSVLENPETDAERSKTIPTYKNWLEGNYTKEMFRSLFPTRNDNILSRSPDTLNPVYGGYESRFGPLTDEKIRETFFDIYLGNYPEADGFNSGKKASTSVVSKQYDVVSSMRNPNSILYGATVQDIAQSIGSTPEALTNWLLDSQAASGYVDAVNYTVMPSYFNDTYQRTIWQRFVINEPLTFKQSIPDAYPNQPVNTQNNLVVLPSSTSTTAVDTAAAPTAAASASQTNTIVNELLPFIPGAVYTLVDGTKWTVPTSWGKLGVSQTIEILNKDGITPKDLEKILKENTFQKSGIDANTLIAKIRPRGYIVVNPEGNDKVVAKDGNNTVNNNQTNTSLPTAGSLYPLSTGKVVLIPDNFGSLTINEQVVILNREGITPTDLKTVWGWTESNINTIRQNYGYTVTDTPGVKQGPVIPNNNVTGIPTTPAVTITNQNTNNPPPSYTFQKLDGSTYKITVDEWISFSPLQQAEWLGNKGFTNKDLIFQGFSDAAIRRYDDQLINAGITTTRFEQRQDPVIPPGPSLRSGGRFVFAVGDVEKDITTPDNFANFTLKEKATFLNNIGISGYWLVLNGFSPSDLEVLQQNGFVITQNDLDKLNGLYINTERFIQPAKLNVVIDDENDDAIVNVGEVADEVVASNNLTTLDTDDDRADDEVVESNDAIIEDTDDDRADDEVVESNDAIIEDTNNDQNDEDNEVVENGPNSPYAKSNTRGITGQVSNVRQQSIIQQQTEFSSTGDWRVRLKLAPGANYLYAAENVEDRGILAPLAETDGVIFPYTPQISVVYTANYEPTSITHSNYKIAQYQSSSVDSIQINCDFTAQDTKEASYLLAVIHFFRSVTKMFYGQDENPKPGTPPPLCYLVGMGSFQFDMHPLVITSFQYNLPDDVDYIRSTSILTSAAAATNSPNSTGASNLSAMGIQPGGLATNVTFSTPPTGQSGEPTYVPTKMKIQISCMPIVSRADISNVFSLRNYGSGKLLQGSKRASGGIW